jgi:hypothetical protein
LAVTLVGCDWLGNVAITQAQPWRALWIPTLVAIAGPGLLLARAGAPSREDLVAVAGLVAGPLLGVRAGTVATALTVLLLVGLRAATDPRVRRLLTLAAALTLIQAVGWYALNRQAEWRFQEGFASHALWLPTPLHDGALLSLLAIAGIVAWRRTAAWTLLTALLLLPIVAGAMGGVDWWRTYRDGVSRYRAPAEAAAINARLPPGASVFWGGDALLPWLALGRPSYLSAEQTAGIVFSRDTAMEAARRSGHVDSILGPRGFMRPSAPSGNAVGNAKPLDFAGAVRLCADPELGAVFVPRTADLTSAMALHDRSGREIGRLVSCSDVRGRS